MNECATCGKTILVSEAMCAAKNDMYPCSPIRDEVEESNHMTESIVDQIIKVNGLTSQGIDGAIGQMLLNLKALDDERNVKAKAATRWGTFGLCVHMSDDFSILENTFGDRASDKRRKKIEAAAQRIANNAVMIQLSEKGQA